MPFTQQPSTSFVETNNTQTKRGIFRNKTYPPTQIVRPKLTNNVIPMKPDRRKFQSKILNRKDQPTELHSEIKRSHTFLLNDQISKNIVDKPSNAHGNVCSQLDCSQINNSASKRSDIKTAMKESFNQSSNFVVTAVHSLRSQMEHINVKKLTTSNAETKLETLLKKG